MKSYFELSNVFRFKRLCKAMRFLENACCDKSEFDVAYIRYDFVEKHYRNIRDLDIELYLLRDELLKINSRIEFRFKRCKTFVTELLN